MAQTQFGRYDKYNGFVGGFRAQLNASMSATSDDVGKVQAVGINASGKVIIGSAAVTGIIGVICPTKVMVANDVIDVMTRGEIMDVVKTTGGAAWTVGDLVYAHADGTVDAVAASGVVVGRIIEGPKASGRGARMLVTAPVATTAS
jgi:hypothetical protein